tara:strand:- start:2284 stop:2679 length:396 start_codon:yes stop_codon:yes gene_type:complete
MGTTSSFFGGGGGGFITLGPTHSSALVGSNTTLVSAGANTAGINISTLSLLVYGQTGYPGHRGGLKFLSGSNIILEAAGGLFYSSNVESMGASSLAISGINIPAGNSISFEVYGDIGNQVKRYYHISYEVL